MTEAILFRPGTIFSAMKPEAPQRRVPDCPQVAYKWPSAEEGPGREGNLNRGLSVPGGLGDMRGTPVDIISDHFCSTHSKGAQNSSAPLSASSTPGISNNDDEIAAGLGREGA